MQPSAALVEPPALAGLLVRLESGGEPLEFEGGAFSGGVAVRSQEDPGRRVFYLVPASVPTARADGESRWLKEHRNALEALLKGQGVSLATIVFAGDWPSKPHRQRLGSTAVRLVSAAHHLWADRLRFHDDRGNLDEQARRAFLQRLGPRWTEEEERFYTEAALREVDAHSQAQTLARESLLRNRPDFTPGRVSVIYGPGGIGKTFFLRRVTERMTRLAVSDPCLGIPVFAELPLLLHTDTLETWLSHRGVRLRLEQIRALVSAGVIIPVLDALDELVRGQAREGSRAFLEQLGQTSRPSGKILLSSRDYYLNLDPLVCEGLEGTDPIELSIGYFTKAGRRRYVQVRTHLSEAAAARWAGKLEEQAAEALGGISEGDLESLIGHPLFLEAFCRIILDIPENKRAAAVDGFRVASPDVFGEIVRKVLEREEAKVQPGWDAKIAGDLVGDWKAPFTPERQERVLKALVLLVARDGARETVRRSHDDDRYRELYHALFRFTRGVPDEEGATRKEIVYELIRTILGNPSVAEHIPDEEREARRVAALDEYAGFLLQHTLSDTRPNPVGDLVFATRHRAYFDYLLADALLGELRTALARPDSVARERFIEWCLDHHIFEGSDGAESEPPFASCLDFVLWHREALDEAIRLILEYFSGDDVDDVLGSYVASLGLAVLLRSGLRTGKAELVDQTIGASADVDVELMENIVPAIGGVHVGNCSFGGVVLGESRLRDVDIDDSDFRRLVLRSAHLARVNFDSCSAERITLTGAVNFTNCRLDFEVPTDGVELDPGMQLFVEQCVVDPDLLAELERAAALRPDVIRLDRCTPIERPVSDEYTRGRFFLNKLMALTRRHGHTEYAVYAMKLRGRSGATAQTFPLAINVLVRAGAATSDNEMVYLTDAATVQRYSGKDRPGTRRYGEVAGYWDPIVRELDEVL